MKLRIGTRGSDLARAQTGWVVDRLRANDDALEVETVVIQTHGDVHLGPFTDEHWPVGGFVGAIERALLDGRIDVAVHSYKDLPTETTPGLTVVAVPKREAPFDVLVTAGPFDLDHPPVKARIATSSPRRAAQLRAAIPDVQIVPVRGNVPTRLARIQEPDVDGVVLAAAGLNRLSLSPPHMLPLPTKRFVPAPGQGALAVQMRAENADLTPVFPAGKDLDAVAALDHPPSRLAVDAERAFLSALGAGCQTPAGALATTDGATIRLVGQLFDREGLSMVYGEEAGTDPAAVGEGLARRLAQSLQGTR